MSWDAARTAHLLHNVHCDVQRSNKAAMCAALCNQKHTTYAGSNFTHYLACFATQKQQISSKHVCSIRMTTIITDCQQEHVYDDFFHALRCSSQSPNVNMPGCSFLRAGTSAPNPSVPNHLNITPISLTAHRKMHATVS